MNLTKFLSIHETTEFNKYPMFNPMISSIVACDSLYSCNLRLCLLLLFFNFILVCIENTRVHLIFFTSSIFKNLSCLNLWDSSGFVYFSLFTHSCHFLFLKWIGKGFWRSYQFCGWRKREGWRIGELGAWIVDAVIWLWWQGNLPCTSTNGIESICSRGI